MAKVYKSVLDNNYGYRVECMTCSSIIDYTAKDIKFGGIFEYRPFVVCPVCGCPVEWFKVQRDAKKPENNYPDKKE